MIRKIAAFVVLLVCMWTLSSCFWDRSGGYGEHDRGERDEQERGGHGEQEERR